MFSTIHAAAVAIRQRQATPLDLLNQCLQRIDQYEDKVKAFVFIDRDAAREQAQRFTAELQAGHYRGPLHGIPVGIKDIIDVFDWPTAAGSKLWANSIAREDATLVAKLRQAGAIFLGKTHTTQYASFDPAPTCNPWNLEKTPGGSSSGSAAGVACGMCLAAIGSQTGGSLTRPAAYCGVATCKPSFGRVSGKGLVPLAHSMDHPGPMARCVWDLAVVLQIIAGEDPGDPATLRAENSCQNLTADLDCAAPPRMGRLRGFFEEMATPDVRAMMVDAEQKLRVAGVVVLEKAFPAAFAELLPRHRIIMAVEGAAFHERRFKNHPEDYQPNITRLLSEGLACPAPEYARCKTHQELLQSQADQWFGDVDVLLTPATRDAAPDRATTGDPAFNSPWSYVGLPTVSIPVGRSSEGLPLSIQLVGRRWGERALLAAAAWCERAIGLSVEQWP